MVVLQPFDEEIFNTLFTMGKFDDIFELPYNRNCDLDKYSRNIIHQYFGIID